MGVASCLLCRNELCILIEYGLPGWGAEGLIRLMLPFKNAVVEFYSASSVASSVVY